MTQHTHIQTLAHTQSTTTNSWSCSKLWKLEKWCLIGPFFTTAIAENKPSSSATGIIVSVNSYFQRQTAQSLLSIMSKRTREGETERICQLRGLVRSQQGGWKLKSQTVQSREKRASPFVSLFIRPSERQRGGGTSDCERRCKSCELQVFQQVKDLGMWDDKRV